MSFFFALFPHGFTCKTGKTQFAAAFFVLHGHTFLMKRFAILFFCSAVSITVSAQSAYQVNSDSTAVPFLRISPDARAGAMGDGGVACANDANAVHWNLANLSFAKKKLSFAVSYTPWLRALVPDVNHAYLAMYMKPDSISAVGVSLRYFSMGNYTGTAVVGTPTQFRPNEFAFDIGYTRKLAEHFAVGMTVRFIQSNPSGINGIIVRHGGGRACAGDISAAWKGNAVGREFKTVRPSVGFTITNIGTKMWYEDRDSAEFLPVNARFGSALEINFAPYHQIILHAEANRLLSPDPKSVNTTMKKLERITLSTGIEYDYLRMFKVRSGYFHEFASHGDNRYLTLGFGVEYNVFQLDFSYLIPLNNQRSPLENTLRFTLQFNFMGKPLSPP